MSQRIFLQDMKTTPIALFVYNRPVHTRQTIEALKNNRISDQSDLIIFSDAPENKASEIEVMKVREYISSIKGFNSVKVVERENNLGLADSIIDGVSQLCDEHGKVIVLEDDLITSNRFLEFMNLALDRYSDQKKVWHISGWNYPIEANALPEVFFMRVMNCWGWATWADRWEHFRKNPGRIMHEWDDEKIRKFNLDGANNFWAQVTGNHAGTIKTWAVFWYATIFEHQGLCLNPAKTFIQNIGHDGSGEHCSETDVYSSALSRELVTNFPDPESENTKAVGLIQEFYRSIKPNVFLRAVAQLKKSIFQTKAYQVIRDRLRSNAKHN